MNFRDSPRQKHSVLKRGPFSGPFVKSSSHPIPHRSLDAAAERRRRRGVDDDDRALEAGASPAANLKGCRYVFDAEMGTFSKSISLKRKLLI